VVPHQPIEPLESNLWRVSGKLPGKLPLQRVMTIARLASGRLVVHSPIALDAAAMATLDGLGDVAFIVVPNAYHRLDASSYAVRYPTARVLAPLGPAPGSRSSSRSMASSASSTIRTSRSITSPGPATARR